MRQDLRGYFHQRKRPESVRLPNIYQDLEARRFLNWQSAAACCFSSEVIFVRRNPSRSTLLEEAGHALQFHQGIYNDIVGLGGNMLADVAMEYMIARVLQQNAKRWGLPSVERNETSARLRRFLSAARKHGGLSWDIRLKLRRSEKSIMRKLESWTGEFSKGG
ncbi:hypothetical protein [Duganella sp. BJB475]|uniref:hypothetical protein n=1 Tax=Duganella sp. BJB475 TaxID=2233914 RepID=UPI0011C0CEB8|nr:hypothetical protein [Duganella sp. BJB475]